jgi:hypothetical protein
VAQAITSILGTTVDVAEALVLGTDVLKFAPIVELSDAARVLLTIWDSLQLVDVSLSFFFFSFSAFVSAFFLCPPFLPHF